KNVPNANESGTSRRGLRTSPAVNVMLFHASAENSDPVCATQIATSKPNAVCGVIPVTTGVNPRGVQRSEKFARTASQFQPAKMPRPTTSNNAPILAQVKKFWTSFPY